MFSLLFLAGISFLLCFALTPLLRNALKRAGILDRPDGSRKYHDHPIPRLGGVPIMIAMALSLAIFAFVPLSGAEAFRGQWPVLLRLIPGAALVFAIGVCDDLFGLRPWQKLAGEAAAGLWLYVEGIRIYDVFGRTGIHAHWFSLPLTLLWLVGCTNAFNLIDGMDGLAAGVGLFATCTMLVGALLQGWGVVLGLITAPLAGALLAFLRFNFNPASMFLGDSGSLTIGFLLGAYGILWSQKSITLLGMTAPVMALAFPILEAGISVMRRFLRGDPIFAGDRGHIHHRLVALGLTPRKAVLLIYGITAIFAMVSLLTAMPMFRYSGLVIILFSALTWVGIQHLGYVEFAEARRILLGGTVRQLIGSHARFRSFRQTLERAESVADCWSLTVDAMRELGFDRLELALPDGTRFVAWLHDLREKPATIADCWTLRIPLGAGLDDGWLEFSRRIDRGDGYLMLQQVIEMVRDVLGKKILDQTPSAPLVMR